MIQIMLISLSSVNFVSKFILILVYCVDLCNLLKKSMIDDGSCGSIQ